MVRMLIKAALMKAHDAESWSELEKLRAPVVSTNQDSRSWVCARCRPTCCRPWMVFFFPRDPTFRPSCNLLRGCALVSASTRDV